MLLFEIFRKINLEKEYEILVDKLSIYTAGEVLFSVYVEMNT
jgi:hypothetical protein